MLINYIMDTQYNFCLVNLNLTKINVQQRLRSLIMSVVAEKGINRESQTITLGMQKVITTFKSRLAVYGKICIFFIESSIIDPSQLCNQGNNCAHSKATRAYLHQFSYVRSAASDVKFVKGKKRQFVYSLCNDIQ